MQTALRLTGLPFLAIGAVLLLMPDRPDAYIDENGALAGVMVRDGALAINKSRASGFVVETWQRALAADTIARPVRKRPVPGH